MLVDISQQQSFKPFNSFIINIPRNNTLVIYSVRIFRCLRSYFNYNFYCFYARALPCESPSRRRRGICTWCCFRPKRWNHEYVRVETMLQMTFSKLYLLFQYSLKLLCSLSYMWGLALNSHVANTCIISSRREVWALKYSSTVPRCLHQKWAVMYMIVRGTSLTSV